MTNQYDYEDDFDEDDNTQALIKDLRRQLKAKSKEAADLSQELSSLRGAARERSVADLLTAKGVNPKVAKLIPADKQNEEDIAAWLDENSDLFGGVSSETGSSQPPVDPATLASAKRLQGLSESAITPDITETLINKINSAESDAEINEIWANEIQKYIL